MAFTTKILKFACTASIIYRATFILISTGAPTEENHDVFLYLVFFIDTDVSQGSKWKQRTILGSVYHFHQHSDIVFQFYIMFNTYKHLCVSGKQKYTVAVWYNKYIPKEFLLVLTEARREIPGKHCSPNLCFSLFLISSLFYTKWSFKDYQTKCAAMFWGSFLSRCFMFGVIIVIGQGAALPLCSHLNFM